MNIPSTSFQRLLSATHQGGSTFKGENPTEQEALQVVITKVQKDQRLKQISRESSRSEESMSSDSSSSSFSQSEEESDDNHKSPVIRQGPYLEEVQTEENSEKAVHA